MDPPAYILSLQNNIRARPISWEGAMRAKTITEHDLKRIKAIDKVRKEQRRQTIEADLDDYSSLLLGGSDSPSIFEAAAKRTDIIQYMLVLTGDLIDDIPRFVDNLVSKEDPYAPFLPLLNQSSNIEDPIPLLTSSVLSSLLSHGIAAQPKQNKAIDEALPRLYTYISKLCKSTDTGFQDIGVQEYSALLRAKRSRELFWKQRKDTVNPLVGILRSATGGKDSDSTLRSQGSIRSVIDAGLGGGVGLQLLYHVLLVIWQLSFESTLVGPGLDEEHDIIPLYIGLLRISPKEKTTRLLLSTLHNILSGNPSLMPAGMTARLPEVLKNLSGRHLNDTDLLDDLKSLTERVEEYTKTQTTFDEYAAEVQSGHLRWSPPHRNETFWRDNAARIVEEDKGALARKLAEILSKEWAQDRSVLAVGCNDVAWLVRTVPDKRAHLEKFGLKARVMQLMQSPDEGVRWESLRAVGEWLRYSFEG
ncbi:ARM repeat-containing protein [Myriangium duriaei CBS 260.36]|uniref:V-type proton ATPase subunit H n=1 Tax=Myriangium duriaei CBS 260.36 TaxID=1168546 RepID=A0A9P4IZT1_9PEZI|nr:ARM repeat-containing protein [Myriangium duriaei CBS 260.36]